MEGQGSKKGAERTSNFRDKLSRQPGLICRQSDTRQRYPALAVAAAVSLLAELLEATSVCGTPCVNIAPRLHQIPEMTDRSEKKVPRRLAAILAADIAGYSALMGANEADTVRSL